MFQRLTSLFFSTSPPAEEPPSPKTFICPEDEEEVDGWLIIDLPDSFAAPPSPKPAPSCLLDESWFVTPPACFTAEGPEVGPAHLESSPLEDLLIEHPSMSVYVTGSTIVLEPGPDPILTPPRSPPPARAGHREVMQARRDPGPRHHTASMPPRTAVLEKASQARWVQRARQRADRQRLSPKVVQRQNRVRERHPRRSKHQGSFLHQPCQRQFNY
ncbi:tumor protein p53-inducible nuclear protein 2 [Petaurus breviceps papuanus]|uniref:tumor protein p53-inducible nuclear protein 2 n=1 Tax=Petaurus breviceps papuanus TaxID=3040969 RepID=UPI0036DCF31A